MLVLTRRVGEAVRIGGSVTVRVLEQRGGQVRLGIEAPAEIPILREELYLEVGSRNREARLPDRDTLAAAAAVWAAEGR